MLKCIMYYYARKADYVLMDEKNTENIAENEMQNTVTTDNSEIQEPDLFVDDTTCDDPSLSDTDENKTESENDTDDDTVEDTATPDELTEDRDTEEEKKEEMPLENSDEKAEVKSRRIDSLFDFIELFIFTLAAVFVITSFFFRYSVVEGDSMVGTLHNGDRLILTSFMYDPEPGDIIVVDSDVLDKVIVKRVIAVGGQTVRITATDVYVDGKKLNEPYVYTDDYYAFGEYTYEVPPEGYIEVTVPDGHVFVMGDHRNISEDSRNIGTIDEDAIIGKVIFRFAPFNKFGKVK